MILRVAEFLGVAVYAANTAAAIPTDTHDLDLVKRLVNDGYRRFTNAYPKWNWLNPLTTVTFDPTGLGSQCVNSEAFRYYLPDGWFGQTTGFWTYGTDGPRQRIETTDENRIRELYAASGGSTTGDPFLVAHRPLAAAAGSFAKRWEAIFFPIPSSVLTVTTRARLYPDKLTNGTDVTIAGFQHDEAVLLAALAAAELQRGDKTSIYEQQYAEALKRSIAIDLQTGNRRLGYNGDNSDSPIQRLRHPYTGVDSYNGVAITS